MNNMQVEMNHNQMVFKIVKGLLFSFTITLISIFIFSMVLTYSDIPESVIPIVIIVLTCMSILIGTMIGVRKISKHGMVNGGIIGGIYVVFLYLVSSIVSTGFTLNMYTILMMITGIVSGVIGGIIGVNMS